MLHQRLNAAEQEKAALLAENARLQFRLDEQCTQHTAALEKERQWIQTLEDANGVLSRNLTSTVAALEQANLAAAAAADRCLSPPLLQQVSSTSTSHAGHSPNRSDALDRHDDVETSQDLEPRQDHIDVHIDVDSDFRSLVEWSDSLIRNAKDSIASAKEMIARYSSPTGESEEARCCGDAMKVLSSRSKGLPKGRGGGKRLASNGLTAASSTKD